MAKVYSPTMTLAQSLNVTANKPLDTRTVVAQYSDLTNGSTTFGGYEYEGMLVYVQAEQRFYVLSNIDQVTGALTWNQISIPQLSDTDEGKLLTVVKINTGTTAAPVYKYEARWVDAPSGLPEIGTGDADAGKVLTVSSNGVAEWKTIEHPTELPTITDTDKGKALHVDKTTGEVVWETVDTSLMTQVTTEELYGMVVSKTLKPGMKYRITDYDLKVDTTKQHIKDILPGRLVINKRASNFDIIATAATTADLFADVELCDKTETTSLYIGWKAKYDIIGNAQPSSPGATTYDYIETNAKGVIYYMEDNFGNSADYDFDNLLYRTILQTPAAEVMNTDHFTFSLNKINDTDAVNLLSLNTPEHQVVSNVKIKSISKYQLPFVFFKYDLTDPSEKETLIDTYTVLKNINISYSEGVIFRNIILRNTSITNSMSVTYVISPLVDRNSSTTKSMLQYMSIFDNLKIDGCELLSSMSYSGEILNLIFTNTHDDGTSSIIPLYINNINVESYHGGVGVSRPFPVFRTLCSQMLRIIKEGLSNANIIATDDDVYLSAIRNIDISTCNSASRIFNDSDEIYQTLTTSNDKKVYKMIETSIKNLTYTIFNLNNNCLEMPQFQSTATSVVELGI